MKNKEPFSITGRVKSFVYAFNGIKTLFKTEHNSWIQFTAATLTIVLGIYLNIDSYRWCLVLFAIGLVFISELFNTSIELLTDMVSPEYNEKAKKIKDLAAGGVLMASVIALLIGLIVFSKVG